MFLVLFLNIHRGKPKVLSPSCDTQNLVLSVLSLFIPFQKIENEILRLQYIGARLQYIGTEGIHFVEKWIPSVGRMVNFHLVLIWSIFDPLI